VLEAPTADYALMVLEKREDICVILTDVDMPGRLNGFQRDGGNPGKKCTHRPVAGRNDSAYTNSIR
jgi:hypothetical protein